ncbi:MAG: hypothetical protein RSB82_02280 [Victivallaceae bacterium]
MYFLVVDTGWDLPWVSLFGQNKVLFDRIAAPEEDNGEFLRNCVAGILEDFSFENRQLYLSVSRGPGRFSALRVGVSFCKGLGAALNVPVLGWKSTEIMYSEGVREKFFAAVPSSAGKVHVSLRKKISEAFVSDLGVNVTIDLKDLEKLCSDWDCSTVIVSNSSLMNKMVKFSFCDLRFSSRCLSRVYKSFFERNDYFENKEIDYGEVIFAKAEK